VELEEIMSTNLKVLVALAFDTFTDLERSIEELNSESAEKILPGFSSIGWTIAHVGQTIDSWLVEKLANGVRNEYLSRREFSKGGTGKCEDWDLVRVALTSVLQKARSFLRRVMMTNLEEEIFYEGSIEYLKGKPVAKNYWLARVIAHTYYHIGEITTIRSARGDSIIDFPGNLETTFKAKRNV
jgi:hypothetical protein